MSQVNINLNILRIEDCQILRPCCFEHNPLSTPIRDRAGNVKENIDPCPHCIESPCPRVNVFKKDVKAELNLTTAGIYTYTYDFSDGEVYGIDAFSWRFQAFEFNSNLLVQEEIIGEMRDQVRKKILITEAGNYDVSISIFTPDGTPTNKPPRKAYL